MGDGQVPTLSGLWCLAIIRRQPMPYRTLEFRVGIGTTWECSAWNPCPTRDFDLMHLVRLSEFRRLVFPACGTDIVIVALTYKDVLMQQETGCRE